MADTKKEKQIKNNSGVKSWISKLTTFSEDNKFLFTAISIFLGLLIGAIILGIAGYNPFEAYWVMLTGIFSRPSYVSWTIIKATPLILTGLSVAFAFRTGLFNIGAEGQFIVGTMTAVWAGLTLNLPAIVLIPVIIILSTITSGIWGGLAGYLKAKFGVHEVISTIMLNWIAFYLLNFMVMSPGINKPGGETSLSIPRSAQISLFGEWKRSDSGISWLAEHPFLKDLLRTPVNLGIILAILLAVLVWFILNKTTLGYRLRSVGFNRFAAEYGGINVNKNIIISMFIAGSLSGLAGAFHVMGVSKNISVLAGMEGYGFDGIAVALIGSNGSLGCVLSGLLFGALKYGGGKIQMALEAPSEIINIVIGTIVFFIAIPKMIIIVKKFFESKKKHKEV